MGESAEGSVQTDTPSIPVVARYLNDGGANKLMAVAIEVAEAFEAEYYGTDWGQSELGWEDELYTFLMRYPILVPYSYSVSTNVIWTSFDFGEVMAESLQEARRLAIEELQYRFSKANDALAHCDSTSGYVLSFNEDDVVVERAGA